MVRSAAFRSKALSLANSFSIGLKLGLQGGAGSGLRLRSGQRPSVAYSWTGCDDDVAGLEFGNEE